jgi:CRP-like cAMP-binding protein
MLMISSSRRKKEFLILRAQVSEVAEVYGHETRTTRAVTALTDAGANQRETQLRRRLLDLLVSRPLTRAEIARALNADIVEVERLINALRDEDLIQLSGLERGGDFGIAQPRWGLRG